jgi:hypothetical protein
MVPKRLPGMHVRDVKLDDGCVAALDRVMERDRRVREGSRIEHDTKHVAGRDLSARLVDPIDQVAFVVRLAAFDRDAELCALLLAYPFNVRQRIVAILRGLPRTRGRPKAGSPKKISVLAWRGNLLCSVLQ